MKMNLETARKNTGRRAGYAVRTRPRMHKPKAAAVAGGAKRFRRLNWDERVVQGDFVQNEHRRFEPWEGPGGFRADAFVKPIYRREIRRPATRRKSR
jgi:hypothetical protein